MVKVSTRPQETATAVIPAVTSVTAPRRSARQEQEAALLDLLEQAKTICTLLAHNFGGDGSFDDPVTAPGIAPLFACVADLMRAADQLATTIKAPSLASNKIEQALGLAEHMQGLSEERVVLGSTLSEGFRIGDQTVAMGYWTIEKLIESAMELPLRKVQA